ncbi:MAG: hypothetical protein ACPGOV_15065 [Magnetovibrionaceae bacterium]
MKTFVAATAAIGFCAFIGMQASTAAQAQEALPKEAINMCIETVTQMAGGNPPKEAVDLCQKGKLEDAIAVAMTGG